MTLETLCTQSTFLLIKLLDDYPLMALCVCVHSICIWELPRWDKLVTNPLDVTATLNIDIQRISTIYACYHFMSQQDFKEYPLNCRLEIVSHPAGRAKPHLSVSNVL